MISTMIHNGVVVLVLMWCSLDTLSMSYMLAQTASLAAAAEQMYLDMYYDSCTELA